MVGRQRSKLFRVPIVKVTVADQSRANVLLRKICEGRFGIAVGSGNGRGKTGTGDWRNSPNRQGWRAKLDSWECIRSPDRRRMSDSSCGHSGDPKTGTT